MTKNLTFALDDQALDTIEKLKTAFGVKSAAEVFRKSLSIASYATKQAAGSDGVVVIRGDKEGPERETRVLLR